MNDDEIQEPDQLKQMLSRQSQPFDPNQSLNRVLSQARRQTATRDVVGFFMSWIWVLFAGFGASMHQAYVKRAHSPSAKSPRSQTRPNHQQGE
ncbi:MAG: hypothetical protein MI808_10540 [Pseudomonadales bacterium]|nr:hypothetical protein [Pseudomonadales bacterium]